MSRLSKKRVTILGIVVVCGFFLTQLLLLSDRFNSLHQRPSHFRRPAEIVRAEGRSYPLPESSVTTAPAPPEPGGQRSGPHPLGSQYFLRNNGSGCLWPDECDGDRIVDQLMYTQPSADESQRYKTILAYNGLRDGMIEGDSSFRRLGCPVNRCQLTADRGQASTADLILWQEHLSRPTVPRPPHQIWMVFLLESPHHTPDLSDWNRHINWTATYRRDSTIPTPYSWFVHLNSSTRPPRNYATGKTKKVAWLVSNCHTTNNRLAYAKQLSEYIQVDIYGSCGPLSCSRRPGNTCFDMISRDYKFYLAFENSNCKDYITEKFFVNGLKNDVLPIVMGAHPDEYKRAAPHHSYIHVDDFSSPQDLATYLHELDKDDDKYNDYFRWKSTGDNLNTYFWCRVCAMLHAAESKAYTHVYEDLEDWWRGPSVCPERGDNLWPKWDGVTKR